MWKGLLLALNHAFDRRSMDLLALPSYCEQEAERVGAGGDLVVSGDGVLPFVSSYGWECARR
jgi:hypothetical protein